MADLDVQPKKGGSMLPWILLGLGLIVLLFFLSRGCSDSSADDGTITAVDSSGNAAEDNALERTRDWWDDVDFNVPPVSYNEISDRNIDVRGNNAYGIYSIGEDVLFDEGKSTIRPQAESNLKQIAASISQRYNNGNIRVYGYTDAVGSAGANKQLAEQRAEAIRNWLVKNGNMAEGQISVHPVGEAQPRASNSTEEGRQQNRRVEIVAGTSGNATNGADSTAGGR